MIKFMLSHWKVPKRPRHEAAAARHRDFPGEVPDLRRHRWRPMGETSLATCARFRDYMARLHWPPPTTLMKLGLLRLFDEIVYVAHQDHRTHQSIAFVATVVASRSTPGEAAILRKMHCECASASGRSY